MFGLGSKKSNLLDEIRKKRAMEEELKDAKTEDITHNKFYHGSRLKKSNFGKDIISGFGALQNVGRHLAASQSSPRASPVHHRAHKAPAQRRMPRQALFDAWGNPVRSRPHVEPRRKRRVAHHESPAEEQREGLFDSGFGF